MLKNLIPWGREQGDEGREAPPLTNLRGELDRMFQRFARDPSALPAWSGEGEGPWMPVIDVGESDKEVTVRAEVPGIDPEDVDVSVAGNQMTITGKKEESTERSRGDTYHRESRYGAFRRVIPLPAGVDPDKMQAECANGVLTVRAEKTGASAARRIAVKAK